MNQFSRFDMEESGSDGSIGPWLVWTAKGTDDQSVPPKSFYLRDADGKTPFEGVNSGIIMDVNDMRTGWQKSEGMVGVTPEWMWDETPTAKSSSPGKEWKKGFAIRCAIGGGKVATWEQASAAAWKAFIALVPDLQKGDGDKLPVVRLADTRFEKYSKGFSTVIPILQVVKWVDRPDCLKADAVRIDTGGGAAPETTAPKAAPKPAEVYNDDLEF